MAQSKPKKPNAPASKSASTRAANLEAARKQREITGVILIALGVLLGAYMFISSAGILGKWLSGVLFGLCGTVCYLLPVILIGYGYITIKGSRKKGLRGSAWFLSAGVLAVVTLMQIIFDAPFENVRYMDFINAAYSVGSVSHVGGGFVGAVLCYPILLLGGKVLAYTVSIALIVIAVIAVTNLSLKDVSDKVTDTVVHAAGHARTTAAEERRLYVSNLSGKPDALAEKKAPDAGDELAKRRKKKKNQSVSDAMEDALSYMPLEGKLKKRPVVSDEWDDLEPGDDVPIAINPVRGAAKRAIEPVSVDPAAVERLFGQHDESAGKRARKPEVTELSGGKKSSARTAALDIDVEPPKAGSYASPPFSLLNAPGKSSQKALESPNEKARLLVETLQSFGINTTVIDISVGPVLTRFELQPAPGIRVARIMALSNDIALSLAAPLVRIEAPIPGKAAIGVEVPNKSMIMVLLREIVESREFQTATSPITLAFGKDISGRIVTADLDKMPHLLIAGATGSGKSVCINDLIISLVYKSSPESLRLILVDPKMVELSNFKSLPHLLIPVVTEAKKAAGALRWAINEMTRRYKIFSEAGAREFTRYNALKTDPADKIPKIVVIIDELADLMMVAPKEVEESICRIAQLGRAAGIHLIVATQRPSADIITGLIKANFPSRCAFAVTSAIDSRIIMDTAGAEKLLGSGDMLFHKNGAGKPIRVQCAYVTDDEVERFVDYFKKQPTKTEYDDSIVAEMENAAAGGGPTGGVFGEGKQEDDLMPEAVRIAIETGQASTSLIQRRLRVGYARGSRLVDMMEQAGYVSPQEGTKPRRTLITRSEYEEIFGVALPPPDDKGV